MSHSFSKNHQHIVFSTAERRKLIPAELQPRLWAYCAGICRNHGVFVREIGGIDDHIHLLVELPAVLAVSNAVLLIKSNSSKWMHEMGREFAWQKGYAAFSVSASKRASVKAYIRNQPAHHRTLNFQAEFIELLKKHGVEFDPKYVFD